MRDERGMVSMISTIIISLLLVIITTSMVVLMNNELRQAVDSDQSIRAYYAAEAGAEDAIWKISKGFRTNQECGSPGSTAAIPTSVPGGLTYTCQRIKFSGPLESTLEKDEADQFNVDTNGRPMQSMRIAWDLNSLSNLAVPTFSTGAIPTGDQWKTSHYPAIMEVSIVRYGNGNSLSGASNCASASDVCLKTFVIIPSTRPLAGGRIDYSAIGTTPVFASCNSSAAYSDGYHCNFSINNIPNGGSQYVVRYRARYAGTAYLIQGFARPTVPNPGSLNPIDLDSNSATVDVTAKAGDITRRIIEHVRVKSGVATGLDYVIYSDTDISKNCVLTVVAGAATYKDCIAPGYSFP